MINYQNKALSFYSKSIAFLESSIILSLQKDNEIFNTIDYQDVINFNCYHSLELFLKFSLLYQCSNQNDYNKMIKKFGHNIDDLYKQYKSIYKEEIFDINYPFDFSNENYVVSEYNVDELKLFKEHKNKFPTNRLDQYLKYPDDKQGNRVSGAYLISLDDSYLKDLKNDLENKFNKVVNF